MVEAIYFLAYYIYKVFFSGLRLKFFKRQQDTQLPLRKSFSEAVSSPFDQNLFIFTKTGRGSVEELKNFLLN